MPGGLQGNLHFICHITKHNLILSNYENTQYQYPFFIINVLFNGLFSLKSSGK